MPNARICVCHPNEPHCQEIISVFQKVDAELELLPIVDLRNAAQALTEHAPHVVVVGVDAPNDPSIRTIESIKQAHPDIAIIVVSPSPSQELLVACIRAGSNEFLEFPVSELELTKALDRLYQRIGLREQTEGKVTAFYSAKGGVGLTMLACNLGAAIAEVLGGERPSCILDLNLHFGCVASYLNIQKVTATIAQACEASGRLDEALLQTYTTLHESGAAVLPAPLRTDETEVIDGPRLAIVIEQCKRYYAHVILDLPHELSEPSLVGLEAADMVLMVCDMTLPSIQNTISAARILQEDLDYKKDKLKLLVNRHYDSNQVSLQELSAHVKLPIFWTVPYDSMTAIHAANAGETLMATSQDSAATRSIVSLAQVIAGVAIGQPKKKRFTLFGRR